ncbi:MAG: transcription antitermination factor NusB [Bacteroidetes bacterium]|nr:transcription antitermination factor NusB [Bacteroidota bacterium]
MLTRRHIRIKVMQSAYSFSHKENSKLQDELVFFEASVSQAYNLHLSLLALIKSIVDFTLDQITTHAKLRSVEAKSHHLELLTKNRVLSMIHEHPILEKKLQTKKFIKWDLEFVFLKDLMRKMTSDTFYKAYEQIENPTWEDDVKWFSKCFKNHIASSDYLYEYFEDQQITWIDDLPLVNTFLSKSFKQLEEGKFESLSFSEFEKHHEDFVFGRELLEKTIANDLQLQHELEGKTPNWDPERIAQIDMVILKIAIAELLYFPSIPSKVTLNEYLEIAKDYSTPNSNNFVNGVLDKLVKEFEQEKRMNKTGRGLL